MGGTMLTRARLLVPLYAVVSCVLTWPLVAHLTTSLTYGDEPVETVPLFNLWTLRWNQSRIGDLYSGYWDAPIFHPNDGAFALSEPQPLTGLVFAPISWLSGNPVLAFNLVSLVVLTLNGYAMARLARYLGVAPGPAALTGAMAVGLSFVANEMGVLQLTVVFPLLFLIEAVVRWAPDGGRVPAARIGIWLAVTFLTCGYYGLFALLGIGLPALVLVRRHWFSWSRLAELALAGVVFAVPALPFLLGQAQITSDYERPDSTIENLSADRWEYRQLVPRARGSEVMPWLADMQSGHGLYPGTALLLLAFAGFWFGGPRRLKARTPTETGEPTETEGADGTGGTEAEETTQTHEPESTEPTPADEDKDKDAEEGEGERTLPRFLLAGVAVTWLLSLGLKLEIFGFQPYEVARSLIPGYQTLRSPFRFAALFELFLLGLAAYGLHELWQWRRTVRLEEREITLRGPVIAMVIVLLGLAEISIAPVRLFEVDRDVADWATWMKEEAPQPSESGDGAVAFVPFPPSGRATDYGATTQRMLEALDAGVATVNGYSGLWPDDSSRLEGVMRDYPSDEAEAALREFGVSYLVVDPEWLAGASMREQWLTDRHTLAFTGEDAVVYEIRG